MKFYLLKGSELDSFSALNIIYDLRSIEYEFMLNISKASKVCDHIHTTNHFIDFPFCNQLKTID